MVGRFCFSKQGHDKGTLYIILEAKENKFLVTDARLHPVAKPKLKNAKHIQLTNMKLPSGTDLTDDNIRCQIRKYKKSKEN
ncbi:MAG: KOW domain-containing RNA-binding protein [Lachnospiraceae bacterium]|nr:KOW domain-containing RNA-binding protein [Lachnospiraceae bacterium]